MVDLFLRVQQDKGLDNVRRVKVFFGRVTVVIISMEKGLPSIYHCAIMCVHCLIVALLFLTICSILIREHE